MGLVRESIMKGGSVAIAMEPPFWNYSSLSGLLLAFALVGYCLH